MHVVSAPTDKIGFHGVDPVAQQASAAQAAATDAPSTQALANALRQALVNLGLIKGGALIAFLLGLSLLLLTVRPAQAYVDTQNLAVTNNIAASTTQTNGMGNAIDVSNNDRITVYLVFTPLGADVSGAVTLKMARSATGTKWETEPLLTVTATAKTTNQVVCVTNIANTVFGAASWVKCYSIQNGATNGLTNITVQVNRQHIY